MNDASLRQDHHDHERGNQGGGSGVAGKRTRTESLQRKAEGTSPPPGHADAPANARDDTPKPTSGQSYVDSIVHGAVDPAKVAAEQIASGLRDENKITNEVYYQLRPHQRGQHLVAGSADAAEWIRLRDEIVRPALARGSEKAPEITGTDLATKADTVAPRNQPVGPSGDALIDDLLARVPPRGSPNKLEAAWLLRALATGLFGAFPQTIGQLTTLSAGGTALRTNDGWSDGGAIKRGLANLEQQKIQGRQLESDKEGLHYEIDGGHLPVLAVMIDLAAGRLREFVRGGMKHRRELFTFGDMVRADVDYAKGGKNGTHSDHTSGNAIDLGFKNFSTDDDVVSVLSALPAGKIRQVFPDGGAGKIKAHVHLALRDDGFYELGIPFAPAFFQLTDSVFSSQSAAEKAAGGAGAPVGTVAHAKGLAMWNPAWLESTGTHMGGGTWDWKQKPKGLARPHIQSGKLKAVLDKMGAGNALDVSVKAAQEDGVDPKTDAHHD